jgi:hypothetical protein
MLNRLDLYDKSRMTGDCHVRFCERLAVKFRLPTRPTKRWQQDGFRIQNLRNDEKFIYFRVYCTISICTRTV